MSLSPSSTGNLIFGLLISGISSCLTSLNFWTTILNLRSYYLTLKTMPLFPWAILITGGMLLLTLPILSGALLMVLADLHSVPPVKELPTFPFLGFYSWDVTARHELSYLWSGGRDGDSGQGFTVCHLPSPSYHPPPPSFPLQSFTERPLKGYAC